MAVLYVYAVQCVVDKLLAIHSVSVSRDKGDEDLTYYLQSLQLLPQ